MNRRDLPVILFSAAYMAVFVALSLTRQNYEFILYALVVVVIAAWIVNKQRTVRFDRSILWGLSLWGLLHMAGGNLRVGDGVLYNVQLIPVVLRYDQFVHAFGFAFAMRLLTGLGNGAAYVPAMALGSAWFSVRKRGFATGIVSGGIGLGLALARSWSHLLDGRLELVSDREHRPGTCFRLTIPSLRE